MKNRGFLICALALLLSYGTSAAQEKGNKQRMEAMQQEEAEDYYGKWLKEDVFYIITSEERAVFKKLTTEEEKEQFIEQFWYRRDPDLRTGINEFKEEHYRRIAYTNERFASGFPGWMTDRGRIYIIHGPPVEIEAHPAGGDYIRPIYEGGGSTSTYPFEIWRYRWVEGIGQDVELEFVDPSFSGEYRLAVRPEEKDALLYIPNAGLTFAEQEGLSRKVDRAYFSNLNRASPWTHLRAKDHPFQQYHRYTMIQRAPEIRYKDLQEIVNINISYDQLPFQIRQDHFRLNEEQELIPITLEFRNKELTFKEERGVHNARVQVYGIVTSITNRVVREFDDDLRTSYGPENFQRGLSGKSIYQKILPLDRKMRYKLDLVVKDVHSGNTSAIRRAIVRPPYVEKELSISSLILADLIRPLAEIPRKEEMFVLGDIKVRPSISKEFSTENPPSVYVQLYNVEFDQASLAPSLEATYTIWRASEPVAKIVDESGESIQFFSGWRIVLIKRLPVETLEPGDYKVEVKVWDKIKEQTVTVEDTFQIVPSPSRLHAEGTPVPQPR